MTVPMPVADHSNIMAITSGKGGVGKTFVSANLAAALAGHGKKVLVLDADLGVAEPSRADEFLTQTLKSALHLVDVRVLDHVIVGVGHVVSLAERGLL